MRALALLAFLFAAAAAGEMGVTASEVVIGEPSAFSGPSAGLGIAVGFLVYTGLTAPRETGAFVPPHVENGRVVPGHFE